MTEQTIQIRSDVEKIHIDSQGFLSLVRKGRRVPTFCPFASSNMTIKCGDWCPMFGEPIQASGDKYLLQFHCAPCARIIMGALDDNR